MKTIQYLCLFLLLSLSTAYAATVGSEFTYQGELKQSGTVADGLYDFEFELFNAAAGGASVSVINDVDNLDVDEGLFNTILDFGNGPFTGDAVFLEIRVREDGSGGFTTL